MCRGAVKHLSQVIKTIKDKVISYVAINTKNSRYSFTKQNFELHSRIKLSLIQYDPFYFLLNTLY